VYCQADVPHELACCSWDGSEGWLSRELISAGNPGAFSAPPVLRGGCTYLSLLPAMTEGTQLLAQLTKLSWEAPSYLQGPW